MKTDDKLIFEQYHTVTENSRQNPVISKGGDKIWFNERGEWHREDGPAVEYANGDKVWYINNELHREDGPAIEHASGSKWWYVNGKTHREDGPAFEGASGSKHWWLNGKRHREDGPAVEYSNGTKEWYINNEYYSTIPKWTKALFIYKGHTPKKLGRERFNDLVRAFAQKIESMHES